jgi:hypothetical protein
MPAMDCRLTTSELAVDLQSPQAYHKEIATSFKFLFNFFLNEFQYFFTKTHIFAG